MRLRRRIAALAAGAAIAALGLAMHIPADPRPADQPSALVYISGYDGHLLEAYQVVPLYREPGGPAIAEVPTDSLAWVHAEAGEWLEVTLAEGEPLRGWIADFFLRGELHLVDPVTPGCPVLAGPGPEGTGEFGHELLDPSTKVQLVDIAGAATGSRVKVRSVLTGATGWVDRPVLSERPGPNPAQAEPGIDCEEITQQPVPPHVRRPGLPQQLP